MTAIEHLEPNKIHGSRMFNWILVFTFLLGSGTFADILADEGTKCVCKPTMKLEMEPSPSTCLNGTVDFLIQLVFREVTQKQNEIKAKDIDLSECSKNVKSMIETIDVLNSESTILSDAKEESKNLLSSQLAKNKGLQKDLEELQKETESYEKQKILFEDQIKKLKENRGKLSKQVEDLMSKTNALQKEIFTLRRENSKLTEESDHAPIVQPDMPQPIDCADIQQLGAKTSGVYTIFPKEYTYGLDVYCDLTTEGGGWIVLQRRQDGSQGFDNDWNHYKHGFGSLAKEHWLGNEHIYQLTHQKSYELRFDLTDFQGSSAYAVYDSFFIDDEVSQYRLHIGEYKGNAGGNSMAHHEDQPFSTKDVDNDNSKSGHCSTLYGSGGWWFSRCYDVNINGMYNTEEAQAGIIWWHFKGHAHLQHVEMKIRPIGFGEGSK